jgi:Rne/Rng family ribonuclease
MSERLLVAGSPAARLILACDADGLTEAHRDEPAARSAVGALHLGRVAGIDRRLGAAFVDLGKAGTGLLPLRPGAAAPEEGRPVLVQVRRDPREGKGPRLSAAVALAGTLLELRPGGSGVEAPGATAPLRAAVVEKLQPGEGWVLRPAAAGAPAAALEGEMARLRTRWAAIAARAAAARPPALLEPADDPVMALLRERPPGSWEAVVLDHRATAEALQRRCAEELPELTGRIAWRPRRDWQPELDQLREQLLEALEPDVPLPGGGWIRIEPTTALTAVDVNSGEAGGAAGPSALRRVNEAAAQAIARQLRLRNIGGLVVIDFIDMESRRERTAVAETLRQALAADPVPCTVGAMSGLGLVEMTRRRRGRSLAESFTEPCPTCGGTGRVTRRDPLLM